MRPGYFRDRSEAGRLLAASFLPTRVAPTMCWYWLFRAACRSHMKSRALNAPLDVFLVRKLGVPGHDELAMGAIATGDIRVINEQIVRALGIPDSVINAVAAWEQQELERRERLYRDNRPPPDIRGRTVILVDDGLATGATMHAAIQTLRQQQPARIVVAVPTASPETCQQLRAEVDDVVCAITPEPFHALGLWYEDFSQTSDEEVIELMARAQREEVAAH